MSFFALKLIALLSMLWDHVTATLWPVSIFLWDIFWPNAAQTPQMALTLDYLLAFLGRIAAPVFLFSIANGYRHTHDVKRYALRLLVFACLAEYPYYLCFGMGGNILFTMLTGLLTLWLFDHGNRLRPGLGWAAAAAIVALAETLALCEGKGRYLLMILTFYLTDHWTKGRKALLWLILLPVARYAFTWDVLTQAIAGTLDLRWFKLWSMNTYGPFLGVALTFFYNGKKGLSFPGDKYLWYAAYPAHLLLLGLLVGT